MRRRGMNKAVMISIRPEWCRLIISGEKTMEVRKTRPKLEAPFKCYIYCTAGAGSRTLNIPISRQCLLDDVKENGMLSMNCPIGNQKVIGEFTCDKIECVDIPYPAFQGRLDKRYIEESCVRYYALHRYFFHDPAYFWHISDLEIYDTPKEITGFRRCCENDLWCESCGMYSHNGDTCGNAALHIKRPPQSWCYLEACGE